MSIHASDIADLFGVSVEGVDDDVPLGTALRGEFSDPETDSVETVRELRGRARASRTTVESDAVWRSTTTVCSIAPGGIRSSQYRSDSADS